MLVGKEIIDCSAIYSSIKSRSSADASFVKCSSLKSATLPWTVWESQKLLSRSSVCWKSNQKPASPEGIPKGVRCPWSGGDRGSKPFCLGCFGKDSWRGWALNCQACLERPRCQASLTQQHLAHRLPAGVL